MPASGSRSGAAPGPRLSIGALSRATAIPVETLRTWEGRYGYPVPERKPSGHRVYPLGAVARLRRIAEALSQGHRAGDVVGASEGDLDELLAQSPAPRSAPAPLPLEESKLRDELLTFVREFDAPGLTRALVTDWARLGPLDFLERRIVPLVRAVGAAWQEGDLEIRHEHFLSERVGDVLRSLRLPFEERAEGPLVVFGSLPGESHGLGLQMAALLLAAAGCRILYLGTEVPPVQMADLARDLNARALAVSVSVATRGPASAAQLRKLRQRLPRRVTLLVGGEGAPEPRPGVEVIRDLLALDTWGRRLAS
jgi:methanogenic corrinoid protein MtbC1